MKSIARTFVLLCTASILPFMANAEGYIIDTAVISTNGGFVLDGGDEIIVTSRGSVTVTSPSGYSGLFAYGGHNELSNYGTISTTGINAEGIYHRGDSGRITNSGVITTDGFSSDGIFHSGDFGDISNSGTISTTGANAHGLFNIGDFGTLSNSGIISTEGIATGFYYHGAFGTVSNSGTISTVNQSANGLYYGGRWGYVSNSGTISTEGLRAEGLWYSGEFGTVINSGAISTAGEHADALYFYGDSGVIINSGAISTDGAFADALFYHGDSGTVTNSGIIKATGSGGYSIYIEGDDNVLNLNEGSVLVGIVAIHGASSTLNFGAGLNAILTTYGFPYAITVANGDYAVVGNTIYVIDATGFTASDQSTFVLGGQVLGALANRHANSFPTESAQSSTGSVGGHLWGQVIGGAFVNSGRADTAGYYGINGGVVIGKELASGNGFYAGFSNGQTANSDAFNISNYGAFAGIYGQLGKAEYSLTAGYKHNDSERLVANNTVTSGIETATASYASYYISPSITLRDLMGMDDASLRLRYLGVYYEGYTEANLAADVTVDARISHFAEARFELTGDTGDAGKYRYGVDAQYRSADATGIDLMGTALSIPNSGDGFAGRGFVGFDISEGGFHGSMELGLSSSGAIDASLSFELSF